MLESLKNSNKLVTIAHPHKELLGLGGSQHRLCTKYGCEVKVVILGEGHTFKSTRRAIKKWNTELKRHQQNINEVRNNTEFFNLSNYSFPDNRFVTITLLDIKKIIEQGVNEFNPSNNCTYLSGDVYIDHQKTFEAVVTATRPMSHENVRHINPSNTKWHATTDPRHVIPKMFMAINKQDIVA